MKRYKNILDTMCKELEKLDKKYANDVPEMSVQDAEKIDMLYHALKSAETYYAMKEASEWDENDMEEDTRSYGKNKRMRPSEWSPHYYPRY